MGKVAFGCIGALAIIVVATLLNGWALMVLWGWFIVPTFAAPALNMGQALGLGVIVSFLTHQVQQDSGDSDADPWPALAKAAFVAIAKPLLALGFGWVYLQFA